jgi:hypothetical protein
MFPLRVGAPIQQCLAIEDYSGFSPAMAEDGVPFERLTPKPSDDTSS